MQLGVDKEEIGVVVGAVAAVGAILSRLKLDDTVTSTIAAVGVITTALFGYLKARRAEKSADKSALAVANITADASKQNTSKTVLVQTVTAERAKWRAEMREHVSELVMLLRASTRREKVEWQRIDRLRSGVRMRLNPAGRGGATTTPDEHPLDRAVHAVLDELARARSAGASAHDSIAERLEEGIVAILKGEWEVSKDEAVKGKLKGA